MPDVDAFGKTTVSQCGGERNERSEAIYRTVSRRLRLWKMPIAWKTGALWGCPSISKKAPDITQEKHEEHATNVIVKTRIRQWTNLNKHKHTLTNKCEFMDKLKSVWIDRMEGSFIYLIFINIIEYRFFHLKNKVNSIAVIKKKLIVKVLIDQSFINTLNK